MQSKIKKLLRRKFELYDIQLIDEYFVMKFKLYHFLEFSKRRFKIKNKNENITFEFKKINRNELEVKVAAEYIGTGNNSLEFYYNNKQLWLVSYENLKDIFEVNDKIYFLKVNKSLILKQYKTNHRFTGENKLLQIDQVDDKHALLTNKDNLDSIILLNRNKQIEIQIEDDKINLSYIQQSTNKYHFKVYVVFNNEIYRAKFTQKYITQFLVMKYIWKDSELFTLFNSTNVHKVNVSAIMNETKLRIITKIKDSITPKDKFLSLGVIENDLQSIDKIPTIQVGNTVFSELPIATFNNIKTKKLIAIYEDIDSGNEKYYVMNSKSPLKFNSFYNFEGQIYNLNILKKNGITLFSSKPNVKMGANFINEKTLGIYFQPNKIYDNFQFYITFEERISQNKYEMPIYRGEQSIDIPYNQIQQLKTASKNIIDIFITIYDGQDVVRKEKIKYRAGIYKKDNYITISKRSFDNKKVYYMFTLTPFKNIKIESFEVSKLELEILENNDKENNVWLIGERTDTAQDNGISFFRWLQKNTDIEAYYVIDENSLDYEKLSDQNNVVLFGSQDHFEVASKAKVLASTHDLENILPYKTASGFWGYEDTIKVFLQHGVLGRKNVEYNKKYYDLPFDIFNVSSTSEKYDIVANQLGYDEKNVYVTGLSRFDNLPLETNNKVKKILIMPTWRDWLNSDFAFNNSEYMKKYLDLIKDNRMIELCKKYNVEINFYPHYRSQEFFRYHLNKTSKEIRYIESGEQTVQELLIEHDILITDYSSVSFDFSYMNKPVIFFHFDVNQFFRKGILRPIEETFIGDIVYNENELINRIERLINSYEIKNDLEFSDIFAYRDHSNSERVYTAILEKMK